MYKYEANIYTCHSYRACSLSLSHTEMLTLELLKKGQKASSQNYPKWKNVGRMHFSMGISVTCADIFISCLFSEFQDNSF